MHATLLMFRALNLQSVMPNETIPGHVVELGLEMGNNHILHLGRAMLELPSIFRQPIDYGRFKTSLSHTLK